MKLTWIRLAASVLWLGAASAGCNAFAEAVGPDEDQPVDSLVFEPYSPVLDQGQKRIYVVSFVHDPPWMYLDGKPFLTRFEFYDSNDRSQELTDIYSIPEETGEKSIRVTLKADEHADTSKVRLLRMEMAFDRIDQPQLHHAGEGLFWVLPRNTDGEGPDGSPDGGTDGGGDP